MDRWALLELIGHFVNYRKQVSPSLHTLLPEGDFQLFAVCARFPSYLAQDVELQPVRAGVYDILGFGLRIRLIVVNQLPQEDQNAMLHLFSAREELIRYGQEHYRPHSAESSTLLYQLLRVYSEDQAMSDKLKEFVRQSIDELLKELPAEERLKGLPAKERLKGLSAEESIEALSPEALQLLARRFKADDSLAKVD